MKKKIKKKQMKKGRKKDEKRKEAPKWYLPRRAEKFKIFEKKEVMKEIVTKLRPEKIKF